MTLFTATLLLIGFILSCTGFYYRGRDMESNPNGITEHTMPSFLAFAGVPLMTFAILLVITE